MTPSKGQLPAAYYRDFEIRRVRFSRGLVIEGCMRFEGYIARKEGINALPESPWFETARETREAIDIFIEHPKPEEFVRALRERYAQKAVAPQLFRALLGMLYVAARANLMSQSSDAPSLRVFATSLDWVDMVNAGRQVVDRVVADTNSGLPLLPHESNRAK